MERKGEGRGTRCVDEDLGGWEEDGKYVGVFWS